MGEPIGILVNEMSPRDAWAASNIYAQRFAYRSAEQVFVLRGKASGEELDPRFFDDAERRRFDESVGAVACNSSNSRTYSRRGM